MTPTPGDDIRAVSFEVYGAHARVVVPDPRILPRVAQQLPVHARQCESSPDDRRFAIEEHVDGGFVVVDEGEPRSQAADIEGALALLRRRLAFFAVDHARDHLVTSAGVVGWEGRAIVLPGRAMAGKSTFVAALLRAGASYYTDDWAVLDGDGRARPFSRMLRIRRRGWISVESLGAVHGHEPAPVGLIARVTFEEGARWRWRWRRGLRWRRLSEDAGAAMLLEHAYGLDDPAAARAIARAAAAGATVIEGERGEADEAARALLELASQTRARGSS